MVEIRKNPAITLQAAARCQQSAVSGKSLRCPCVGRLKADRFQFE